MKGSNDNSAAKYLSLYPDFNESLQRYGESKEIYKQFFEGENVAQTETFKFKAKVEELYDSRRKNISSHQERIPRLIHHIWLGSPVPERYQFFIATWQGWEGWTHQLWTDEEVKHLQLHNQCFYDQAETWVEKADILRYELLNLFGGIYVDIDMLCLNPGFFHFAHQFYSFYIGIEPLEYGPMSCCNALIAATPQHPMLKAFIHSLQTSIQQLPNHSAVERTGPKFISKIIASEFHLLKDGMIFPPTFFYPIQRGDLGELLISDKERFLHPETMALHFWEGNWR